MNVIICLISKSPQFRTACSKLANRLFRPRTDRKVLSSERSQLNSVSPGLRNRLAFLDNEQTLPSSKTKIQRRDLLVFLPVLKRIFLTLRLKTGPISHLPEQLCKMIPLNVISVLTRQIHYSSMCDPNQQIFDISDKLL